MTTQKIKIWKPSHGSPIAIFSLYANIYKHMYGDFTKDEKEKSQYLQDTSYSEAEEGNGDRPWEMLYDYIVDPAASQPSEETSGCFHSRKKKLSLWLFCSWWLLGNISLRSLWTLFCVLQFLAWTHIASLTNYSASKVAKVIAMRLPSESFQILIFWVVVGRSFLFLLLLCHYALLMPPEVHGLTSDVWKASSTFPTVWAGEGMSLVFIQAGLAVDPPTAGHLVRDTSHEKTDLTHQLIRWCLHKLAIVPTSHWKVGSHLLQFFSLVPRPFWVSFLGGKLKPKKKVECIHGYLPRAPLASSYPTTGCTLKWQGS